MTPLECIAELKLRDTSLVDMKLSYAGRLDPMAEGMVLILVGDENKQRDQFLGLDKKYEAEMILGIETDSYDVLGIPAAKPFATLAITDEEIRKVLNSYKGTIDQRYPPFSSKTVHGKPLYWWTRANRLSEIKIPSEKRTIYDIQLNKVSQISKEELHHEIVRRLKTVNGDFRQENIKAEWEQLFSMTPEKPQSYQYSKVRFSVSCSSGTYVRSLVHDMGKKLKTGAFVISLVRTSIGDFSDCNVDLRSKII